MELLTSSDWTDYELIDTGNREKLERFGKYILIRPEPQAVWPKAMPEEEWDKLHHARFSRGKSESLQSTAQSQQTNTKAPRHQGTTAPQHHGTTAPSHKNPGSGIRDPISDDQAAEQFEILMDIMEKAGYVQYEISNFCLPGFESRHNSNYWKGVPYLGLGPSAHSYNGTSRRWNISNLTSYIRDLGSGILPFEEELLTVAQEYNEYVMTSLRTIRGSDLREIGEQFGMEYVTYFRHQAIRHLASGHLTEQSGICTLTRNGKFLADGIAADLFVVE